MVTLSPPLPLPLPPTPFISLQTLVDTQNSSISMSCSAILLAPSRPHPTLVAPGLVTSMPVPCIVWPNLVVVSRNLVSGQPFCEIPSLKHLSLSSLPPSPPSNTHRYLLSVIQKEGGTSHERLSQRSVTGETQFWTLS